MRVPVHGPIQDERARPTDHIDHHAHRQAYAAGTYPAISLRGLALASVLSLGLWLLLGTAAFTLHALAP